MNWLSAIVSESFEDFVTSLSSYPECHKHPICLNETTIVFEYDENKSQANLNKHGINFINAQKLWDNLNLVEIPTKYVDEQR